MSSDLEDQIFSVQENLSEVFHHLVGVVPDSFWVKLLPNLHTSDLMQELVVENHPVIYEMCNPETKDFFTNYKKREKNVIQIALENKNFTFLDHLIKNDILLFNPKKLVYLWENIHNIKPSSRKEEPSISDTFKALEQITEASLKKIQHVYSSLNPQEILNEKNTAFKELISRVLEGQNKYQCSITDAFLYYKPINSVDINKAICALKVWGSYPHLYNKRTEVLEYFLNNQLFTPNKNTYKFLFENGLMEEVKKVEEICQKKKIALLSEQEEKNLFSKVINSFEEYGPSFYSIVIVNKMNKPFPEQMNNNYKLFFNTKDCKLLDKFWLYAKNQHQEKYNYVNFTASLLQLPHDNISFFNEKQQKNKNITEIDLLRFCFMEENYLKIFLDKNNKSADKIEVINKETWLNCYKEIYQMLWTDNYEIKQKIGLMVFKDHKDRFSTIMKDLINNFFLLYKNLDVNPRENSKSFSQDFKKIEIKVSNVIRSMSLTDQYGNITTPVLDEYKLLLEKNILMVLSHNEKNYGKLKL